KMHGESAPGRGGKPIRPELEIASRIGLEPKPHVAPWSRFHQGRRRVVFALREAQRCAGRLERAVDIVGKPAVVTEFECRAMSVGKQLEKLGQAWQVLL